MQRNFGAISSVRRPIAPVNLQLRAHVPAIRGKHPISNLGRCMSSWSLVRHLFEEDDGSLPDIFVEQLSRAETVAVYEWVMSRCALFDAPTAWHIVENRDVLVSSIPRPAQAFVDGVLEMFRHGLVGLSFDGIELPSLTICVESGGVSFDYRKGTEWNERTVEALFSFLAAIKRIAPNAVISQAEEGYSDRPSEAFSSAFEAHEATSDQPSMRVERQQSAPLFADPLRLPPRESN